jgi:inner membrane protein
VHRGFTHSLLFGLLAAILLALITKKLFLLRSLPIVKLFFFFCLQICLHDMLDTCNAYGTGLFEPFNHRRFSFHLLFVADPFFSISIVIAFVALVIVRKGTQARKRWVLAGLLPAFLYLFYALFNKALVNDKVKKSLLAKHSWLWYIVTATDSGYFIGYCSVFDLESFIVPFTYYPRNEQFLQTIDTTINAERLLRFANNYYTVAYVGDTLIFNVLRFGQVLGWQDPKAQFAFQYFLKPSYDNSLMVQRGRFKAWNKKTLIKMYERIKGK